MRRAAVRWRVGFLACLVIWILLTAAGCQRTPPGMILIPAGPFIMGSDEQDTEKTGLNYSIIKPWFEDEHPARTVTLPAYYIDQYEVTNQQ